MPRHGRPTHSSALRPQRPKLTKEQRRKASVDLTVHYLSSYFADWRLTQVLTIEKLLAQRYSFYADLLEHVRPGDDPTGDGTIAQEIQNGLHFDAIAHCVQYVEDLFALIEAAKEPDYFIKRIVTYNAGSITNKIRGFKATRENVADAFHFPLGLTYTSEEGQRTYEQGITTLCALVADLVTFYTDHAFFYNQYKHGLAVAMRPFARPYPQEQIDKDKAGDHKPYLVVYDNMNLNAGASPQRKTFDPRVGVFMPGFTDNVRPIVGHLAEENNFLRFVFPPDWPHFMFERLVDAAFKARACVQAFIANYLLLIQPPEPDGSRRFQLPLDHRANKACVCPFFPT
jgi:hypothetical protein